MMNRNLNVYDTMILFLFLLSPSLSLSLSHTHTHSSAASCVFAHSPSSYPPPIHIDRQVIRGVRQWRY